MFGCESVAHGRVLVSSTPRRALVQVKLAINVAAFTDSKGRFASRVGRRTHREPESKRSTGFAIYLKFYSDLHF